MGTTTTTTPFNPEVPGAVVADRVCIFFENCGNCFNYCDCQPKIVNTLTTTRTIPPIEPVCQDYPVETIIIGVFAFFIATYICLFIHERCVKMFFKDVKLTKKCANNNPGKGMMSMLESMHSTVAVKFDPLVSQGVPTDNGMHDVQTETTTVSYNGYGMSFVNFFTTALITYCVVHAVHWVYSNIATVVFNTTNDGVWNSIDLKECPFSLWGIWMAIWWINWFSLTYYYGWATFYYHKHEAKSPMLVQGTLTTGAGGFFGFF